MRSMSVSLGQRLLRLSLFTKLLVANSSIVALGATAGTYLTTQHVLRSPHGTHYEMMALLGVSGLALSLVINALLLRTALLPLTRLERTARRVRDGNLDARVPLGAIGDPDTDQLAVTFNAMLESLRIRTDETEAYSARLQELSDRVLVAQEDERHRLAGELHDETGQALTSLLLGLRLFRDSVDRPDVNRAVLKQQASDLTGMVRETLDGVRRMALELRPRMLDDLGLVTALRAYMDEWSQRTHITARLDAAVDTQASTHTTHSDSQNGTHLPLSAPAEIALYRMVQEALINVAKHAGATSVVVSLELVDGALVVEVRDNGRGIAVPAQLPAQTPGASLAHPPAGASADPSPHRPSPFDRAGEHPKPPASQALHAPHSPQLAVGAATGGLSAGLGLFSIRERINLAGGSFAVHSVPGQGTTLRATIPIHHARTAAASTPSAAVPAVTPPLAAARHATRRS